jgi:hypothetical protein
MRWSNSFLQLAKGSLIAFTAISKGNQIPFRASFMRKLRIAFNVDVGEFQNSVYHPRFLYHFQSDPIWCDGTFKDL